MIVQVCKSGMNDLDILTFASITQDMLELKLLRELSSIFQNFYLVLLIQGHFK